MLRGRWAEAEGPSPRGQGLEAKRSTSREANAERGGRLQLDAWPPSLKTPAAADELQAEGTTSGWRHGWGHRRRDAAVLEMPLRGRALRQASRPALRQAGQGCPPAKQVAKLVARKVGQDARRQLETPRGMPPVGQAGRQAAPEEGEEPVIPRQPIEKAWSLLSPEEPVRGTVSSIVVLTPPSSQWTKGSYGAPGTRSAWQRGGRSAAVAVAGEDGIISPLSWWEHFPPVGRCCHQRLAADKSRSKGTAPG